jgi:selenocysteine lyase/cysteine desulfurase
MKFAELDLFDAAILNRKHHSNIFNIKGNSEMFQKLKKNNIICSLRGDGIRVGFHFYNTEADLDKLISVL